MCLQYSIQPQYWSWAILRHVMVPEALMEPAPAAATLAGCPTPLGLFHHPTAMHPAQVLAKGGAVALGYRCLKSNAGSGRKWENHLGESMFSTHCFSWRSFPESPALLTQCCQPLSQYHAASTKRCRPEMICSNVSSAEVPTNRQQCSLKLLSAAQNSKSTKVPLPFYLTITHSAAQLVKRIHETSKYTCAQMGADIFQHMYRCIS